MKPSVRADDDQDGKYCVENCKLRSKLAKAVEGLEIALLAFTNKYNIDLCKFEQLVKEIKEEK